MAHEPCQSRSTGDLLLVPEVADAGKTIDAAKLYGHIRAPFYDLSFTDAGARCLVELLLLLPLVACLTSLFSSRKSRFLRSRC